MEAQTEGRFARKPEGAQSRESNQNEVVWEAHATGAQAARSQSRLQTTMRVDKKCCMKLPIFVLLGLLASSSPRAGASETGGEKPPGMVSRFFDMFRGGKDRDKLNEAKGPNWKRLQLKLIVDPLPVKLADVRQLKVTLQLSNNSKRFVQLEFPTAQRIEVLIRDKSGKLVEQWSEDQSFAGEPSIVSVNAGERLEYAVNVATRDMVAGETYLLEAFFPNYEPLKAQLEIKPEK